MDLVVAILKEVQRQCGDDVALISRHTDAICEAATQIVMALDVPYCPSTPGCGIYAWLNSDDTGRSSKFMAHILARGPHTECHWPHDPSDFGRCVKFLAAVPEAREKMELLSDCCPEWNSLVFEWPELEALYREELPTGTAPKLYARMKELGL